MMAKTSSWATCWRRRRNCLPSALLGALCLQVASGSLSETVKGGAAAAERDLDRTPNCLCVFDIDRTLTGKQGDTQNCPMNAVTSMWDDGYGGGNATLSPMVVTGIRNTFCDKCYLGICSAGIGNGVGSEWNNYILNHVMRGTVQDAFIRQNPHHYNRYSWGESVHSPYVLGQPDTLKQNSVELIRQWYGRHGVQIDAEEVYFFGDRLENMKPFAEKGMNSRQVSCYSRDPIVRKMPGMVGYCGGAPSEIVRVKGNFECIDQDDLDEASEDADCLCVFDVDRTLTGKHEDVTACPKNRITHFYDRGFDGGNATLSNLAATGIGATFCDGCYLGLTWTGVADTQVGTWSRYIVEELLHGSVHDAFTNNTNYNKWSYWSWEVRSPFVMKVDHSEKVYALDAIRRWYDSVGVQVEAGKTYYFTSADIELPLFGRKGYNTRQVSCASRDSWFGGGLLGYCGAEVSEVQQVPGNLRCPVSTHCGMYQ